MWRVRILRGTAAFVLGLGCSHVGASGPSIVTADGTPIPSQPKGGALHLVVGHSVVITSGSRLKRVYVSNPAAVGSLTSSPHEVLVTAKASGVSSLVLWDEMGRSSLYTVSADLDVEALRGILTAAFPDENVTVSALQDRIELSGTMLSQADADLALKLAQTYGKDIANSLQVIPPHPKQVELKVRFVEVDRVKLAQFGFNFYSGGTTTAHTSTQQFSSFGPPTIASSGGSASTSVTVTNPLNFFLYNSQYDIGVALKDLETKQVAQILAEPTITSISGEEASFLSGGEFPFPIVQTSGGLASVTIQFRPYGVHLTFTPTVNADGTIRLKVMPEVSALDYTNQVQISGYIIPAISTRRAQTDIELRSGQSFAISGLLDRRITDALSKTPGIASVPILGQLFKSKDKSTSLVDLMVIVTPTIVDPLEKAQPITEPSMPVPNLDKDKFDKDLNNKNKQ
jgi:pilus assembly protein CpaC